MSGRTAMSERERQAAERQALLNGYLAAYRRLRPNGPDLDLSFERGWWIFMTGSGPSRVRTTEFVAMKKEPRNDAGTAPGEWPMTETWPDHKIRELWRAAGGSFYGPNVEHADMEEAKFLPFMRALLLDAVSAETQRCAKAVAEMRNQRHAYRRILGDPKAILPQHGHWASPFVDDVTLNELRHAQPLELWTEAEGPVLWWRFPIEEPPYIGTPLDRGHTVELHTQDSLEPRVAARCSIGGWPGYHTHWTRIVLPEDPGRG